MNGDVTAAPTEAHLWLTDPDELAVAGHLPGYLAILSGAERERMGRFHFERDRRAFLAAHGLLRTALSARAPQVPPDAWEFGRTEPGRPEIASPCLRPRLRFNISHTQGLVACLVTSQVDCGIDVETLDRGLDVGRLASTVLSPAESARLQAVPAHARLSWFFRYWTLKEAYLKARGCGLTVPMNKCTFEFHPGGIGAELAQVFDDDADCWRFAQWFPTRGHLVAVALRCGPAATCRIVEHRLSPCLSGDPGRTLAAVVAPPDQEFGLHTDRMAPAGPEVGEVIFRHVTPHSSTV